MVPITDTISIVEAINLLIALFGVGVAFRSMFTARHDYQLLKHFERVLRTQAEMNLLMQRIFTAKTAIFATLSALAMTLPGGLSDDPIVLLYQVLLTLLNILIVWTVWLVWRTRKVILRQHETDVASKEGRE